MVAVQSSCTLREYFSPPPTSSEIFDRDWTVSALKADEVSAFGDSVAPPIVWIRRRPLTSPLADPLTRLNMTGRLATLLLVLVTALLPLVPMSPAIGEQPVVEERGVSAYVLAPDGTSVSVPGLAPYRVALTVPDSRSLRLPVIRLAPGAYFRVRLVTPAGKPILANRLVAFRSARSPRERMSSSCTAQTDAGPNTSASSTATYTRQSGELTPAVLRK